MILTGTRERRLEMGKRLGADHVVDVTKEDAVAAVQRITGGKGVHYVLECSGAPNALNEAARMVNRGGRICLAAFPAEPVPVDLAYLVRNNIYVFGIRGEGKSATHRAAALMAQKRFDAKLIHTHTFGACRGADRHQIRARAHRGRDQGGREDVRKLARTHPEERTSLRVSKGGRSDKLQVAHSSRRASLRDAPQGERGDVTVSKSRSGNRADRTRPAAAVTFIATCVKEEFNEAVCCRDRGPGGAITLERRHASAENGASCATNPARWRASRPAPTSTRPRPRAPSRSTRPIPSRARSSCWPSFNKMFPKIKTSYVRLQAGALYAKVLSERQAKSYLVDVIQISDMGMILDFQKRGGFRQYISPEMAAFKPEYKSTARGLLDLGLDHHGAASPTTPTTCRPPRRPRSGRTCSIPKWKDAINVKVSNSGLQHGVWYMLKPILGDGLLQEVRRAKPRAFDSYVQQYGRLVDGQDKIIMGAQYSGYIEFKAKGAPLAFVFPETGVPAVSETYGIVADGPHPNAAELFMDWFLSPVGQQALAEALLLHSPRADVPAAGAAACRSRT